MATSAEADPRGRASSKRPLPLLPDGHGRRSRASSDPPFAVVRCTRVRAGVRLAARRGRPGDRALRRAVLAARRRAKDYGYTDYRADAARWRRTYELRGARARRAASPPPGRVLDVGCAAGYFLGVMRDAGLGRHGASSSRASIAAEARAALGDERVHVGHARRCAVRAGASFDLITFWDVVEHLPDPIAALRQARELLAPGGLLLIETQNVSSPLRAADGPALAALQAGRAPVALLPRRPCRLLLERGGWSAELAHRPARREVREPRLRGRARGPRASRAQPGRWRRCAAPASCRPTSTCVDEMIALARPALSMDADRLRAVRAASRTRTGGCAGGGPSTSACSTSCCPRERPLESLDVGCGYGAMLPGPRALRAGRTGSTCSRGGGALPRRRGFERVRVGVRVRAAGRATRASTWSPSSTASSTSTTTSAALRESRARAAARRRTSWSRCPPTTSSTPTTTASPTTSAATRARELRAQARGGGLRARARLTYVNALLFPVILPLVLAKKLRERLIRRRRRRRPEPHALRSRGLSTRRCTGSSRPSGCCCERVSFPAGHSIFALAVKRGG